MRSGAARLRRNEFCERKMPSEGAAFSMLSGGADLVKKRLTNQTAAYTIPFAPRMEK